MNKLYSVLTAIFDDYENVREVVNPSPMAEYILVTDNKELKSDTWTIVYDEYLCDYNPYAAAFYVRCHPFEFVNTNTCLWIDGSINILDDCTNEVMLPFIQSNYELAEILEPGNPVLESYRWAYGSYTDYNEEWAELHGYKMNEYENLKQYFIKNNYTPDTNSGYVTNNFFISKNTPLTNKVNNRWWEMITRFCERHDWRNPDCTHETMCAKTYIIWKYMFQSDKLMLLSNTTVFSKYFKYCYHKTDVCQLDNCRKFLFKFDDQNFPWNWVYYFHNRLVQPIVYQIDNEKHPNVDKDRIEYLNSLIDNDYK